MDTITRELVELQLTAFQTEYTQGQQRINEIQETLNTLSQEANAIGMHLARVEGAMHACQVILGTTEEEPVNLDDFRR